MAKSTHPFEIRVALIGYVSVGKSTVLNALLGAKYGEVSMSRTTAVVNHFRISNPPSSEDTDSSSSPGRADWSMIVNEPLTAAMTLAETTKDNAESREFEKVKEKTYDVLLDVPLLKMRNDTKLVLVDIPGINEAGSSRLYREYLEKAWHTFDVAVLVMDGAQGVNTDEQVFLLELVKGLGDKDRNVPTIILCNKVDDPDDKEHQILVGETRKAVEEIFDVSDRAQALQVLLEGAAGNDPDPNVAVMPAFIPVSAMHAFIYRSGSRLTYEQFQAMDDDYIEKLGKESYGRQWRRLSKKRKLEMTFESVSDAEQCRDGVHASNFDTFLKVLTQCIGDESEQLSFIEEQFSVSLKRLELNAQDSEVVTELTSVYNRLKGFDRSTTHLPAFFWTPYKLIENQAFDEFIASKKPGALAKPMRLLIEYADLLKVAKWEGEMEKVSSCAKRLVLRQAGDVVNRAKQLGSLSAQDHSLMFGSMLLVTNHWFFAENFGTLKLALDARYAEAQKEVLAYILPTPSCERCGSVTVKDIGADYCRTCKLHWIDKNVSICPRCEGEQYCLGDATDTVPATKSCTINCDNLFTLRAKAQCRCYDKKYEEGQLVPSDEALYKESTTVVVPDSPRDPRHFGHLIWSCCRMLQDVEGGANRRVVS